MRVYLDNAASSVLDPEVLEYMLPWYREFHGNPSSVHYHGRNLRSAIEQSRKKIAELTGSSPGEIFFTSGGTEADNMAIRSTVEGLGIRHIVSTRIEHHAVGHCIELLEEKGHAKVTWLDVDSRGHIDLKELREVLKSSPRSLVCLMHANNEIGTMLDLEAVGRICREFDAVYHSDTVQTMGNVKYDTGNLPVDFLTASAHKFYGPKGIGFLYIRKGLKIPPLILGGGQERNMRAGTENVPAIAGMAFALEKCIRNLEEKNEKLWKLKLFLKTELEARIPGVEFNGETAKDNSLVTVLNTFFPIDSADSLLLMNLDIAGISCSGGSACTSGSVKGSHVLAGIGCSAKRSANSVRFSFGVQNTAEELEFTVGKLEEIMKVKTPV